jgi:3'-phosphoadenosine 5'-phosphosulfate sulfotransferase
MNDTDKKLAIKEVLLERLAEQRIPRLLDIKEMLSKGGTLSNLDMEFLDEALGDANQNKHIFDENPDIQDIFMRVVDLFEQITELALENETDPVAAAQNVT